MATNSVALQPVTTRGWRMGLANMLGKEFGQWFKTRSWLAQAIVWTLLADGLVLIMRYQPQAVDLSEMRELAAMLFIMFGGAAPAVGAAISMQDAIIGEKQSGTAAWVLSKPVSRSAFVISKLLADGLGFLVCALLIPGLAGYAALATFPGPAFEPVHFAQALGLMYLHAMFYLTMTLMLGTIFSSRGPVIGIPLGLLFGYQLVLLVAPALKEVLPYTLVIPIGEIQQTLAGAALHGQPLGDVNPIIGSIVGIVLFTAVALWRFRREEF